MSNLKKLLIATIDAEISERGQSPIVLNTNLVHSLNAKQYSIQQIADCVILEHYRYSPGFNLIAKQVYGLLTMDDDRARKYLYQYLGAQRLTVHLLKDTVFEERLRNLNEVYEFALEVLEEEDFVWDWMTSNIPALNARKPIQVMTDIDQGVERVLQCLNSIKYGDYA